MIIATVMVNGQQDGSMPKKKTFGNLKRAHRSQLKAVIRELSDLPTPNLLSETFRLRGVDITTSDGQAEADRNLASIMAYIRLQPYLMALRYFNGERLSIGRQIYDYLQVPYPTREEDVKPRAFAELLSADLSGMQEVTYHFMALSIKHILSYLNLASAAVGHELSPEDYEFLDHYRDLRDYYEHYYNRLPGRTHEAATVTRTISEFGYRVRAGLRKDELGRIVVRVEQRDDTGKRVIDGDGNPVMVDKPVDVTRAGMRRIEDIVERNWYAVRKTAITGFRDHFAQHPDKIPSPEEVRYEHFTSAGGYGTESDELDRVTK